MSETDAFLDSNVLVYVFDASDPEKHQAANRLWNDCLDGKRKLWISTQVLGEFFRVATKKIQQPLMASQVCEIVERILHFKNLPVSVILPNTVLAAMQTNETTGVHYWDCLIAETAKANGVYTIFTENTKDFSKISGIKAKNPFN